MRSAAASCTAGADLVALGLVVGLDYRDGRARVHVLLQRSSTSSAARCWPAEEMVEWGAKTIPEAVSTRSRAALRLRRVLLATRRGFVTASLKGFIRMPLGSE